MEGFIGQIMLFGGNFAPRSWAFCQGQLLAISQNTALFSILGTIYGGDGRSTFGLPDLRGRQAIGVGNGPGLPSYREGERGGTVQHSLTVANLPSHNHGVSGHFAASRATHTTGATGLAPANGTGFAASAGAATGQTGGNQAVNHQDPFLAVHYIICLVGVFPSRS